MHSIHDATIVPKDDRILGVYLRDQLGVLGNLADRGNLGAPIEPVRRVDPRIEWTGARSTGSPRLSSIKRSTSQASKPRWAGQKCYCLRTDEVSRISSSSTGDWMLAGLARLVSQHDAHRQRLGAVAPGFDAMSEPRAVRVVASATSGSLASGRFKSSLQLTQLPAHIAAYARR